MRAVTDKQIHEIAQQLGLNISGKELDSFTLLANELLQGLDDIDQLEQSQPTAKSRRTVSTEVPTKEEDPFNALVLKTEVKGSQSGVLAGKRLVLKDSIAIDGVPMTGGSDLLQGFVPEEDSVVTERILAAGGTIVGVTNMDNLAIGGRGDTSKYGIVQNPLSPNHTAGGSSGGSGAALYYEGIDGAIGTDNGGSIRIPSSFCGAVGLKPSFGLVPYTHILGLDQTIDHAGPMARDVETVARILDAIAGRHPSDPRQAHAPEACDSLKAIEACAADLSGYRIAALAPEAMPNADPAVIESYRTVMAELKKLKAEIEIVPIPMHERAGSVILGTVFESASSQLLDAFNGYQWTGHYWPQIAEFVHEVMPERINLLSPQAKITMLLGTYMRQTWGGYQYARTQNLRHLITEGYESVLANYDAILMPTCPQLPPPNEELGILDMVIKGWSVLDNTYANCVTGHPAVSLPLGQADNLPIGMMLVGKRWKDDELLKIAKTCENTMGFRPA